MNRLKYFALCCITALLGSCGKDLESRAVTKTNPLIEIMSASDNSGFARADKKIKFEFPKDHFAHKDFKSEWWYFTGNLQDQEGRNFGYQFTIFRSSTRPNDLSIDQSHDSSWQGNQIYMGHLAISDIDNKKFYSFELLDREAIGLAGITEQPFKVWVNNWSMSSIAEEVFPLKLEAMEAGVGIDLRVTPLKDIVLQGDDGLSQKSSELGNASYYYSITRLQTEGRIKILDNEFIVQGQSWMDREWSTSALSAEQEGWDWFSLQLSNDTELMYYQLRNNDGSLSETSRASFVNKDSKKINLSKDDVQLEVLEYWQYKESKYPIKWSMKISCLNLDLIIEPMMKNQLHDFFIPYWEGAVRVRSNDGSLIGKGYVELTGY
jgi:predicted secreted hydrolase